MHNRTSKRNRTWRTLTQEIEAPSWNSWRHGTGGWEATQFADEPYRIALTDNI